MSFQVFATLPSGFKSLCCSSKSGLFGKILSCMQSRFSNSCLISFAPATDRRKLSGIAWHYLVMEAGSWNYVSGNTSQHKKHWENLRNIWKYMKTPKDPKAWPTRNLNLLRTLLCRCDVLQQGSLGILFDLLGIGSFDLFGFFRILCRGNLAAIRHSTENTETSEPFETIWNIWKFWKKIKNIKYEEVPKLPTSGSALAVDSFASSFSSFLSFLSFFALAPFDPFDSFGSFTSFSNTECLAVLGGFGDAASGEEGSSCRLFLDFGETALFPAAASSCNNTLGHWSLWALWKACKEFVVSVTWNLARSGLDSLHLRRHAMRNAEHVTTGLKSLTSNVPSTSPGTGSKIAMRTDFNFSTGIGKCAGFAFLNEELHVLKTKPTRHATGLMFGMKQTTMPEAITLGTSFSSKNRHLGTCAAAKAFHACMRLIRWPETPCFWLIILHWCSIDWCQFNFEDIWRHTLWFLISFPSHPRPSATRRLKSRSQR